MRIVASEVDAARKGVWLTIESELFAEVLAGAPVPVFEALWLRDPRAD
jgi:hypothetical protein